MKRLVLVVCLWAALGFGCTSISAGVDYDQSVDFTAYKTAAWDVDQVILAPGSNIVSSLTGKRILLAVEKELSFRGIDVVDDVEQADLVMVAIVGSRDKIRYETNPDIYNPRLGWCGTDCYDAYVHPHVYTQGTLSMDFFDAHSGEPVLHGWASKSIKASDRRNPKKSIEAVVAAMFAKLPMPWIRVE